MSTIVEPAKFSTTLVDPRQTMITSYFMRKVGIVEYPSSRTEPAYLTSHSTVEQVLPGIMAHMRRMKRVKATEETMRRFLNSLINEDDVVAVPGAVNPKDALPLPQVLQRRLGTVETTVECWTRFYKSSKDLFDHVLDVIRVNRDALQVGQVFEVSKDASVLAPQKKKRKVEKGRKTDAPRVDVQMPLKALMLRKCEKAVALDEWEREQRCMRDKVLEMYQRPHCASPPSSPKAKAGQIVKMTDAELLLHEVSSRPGTSSEQKLDALCNLDVQLPPESYDPPFDRNDLFLTNVEAARRLFEQEAEATKAALKRKKARLPPIDLATFPGNQIVLIQYRGMLEEGSSDTVECNYVTWCCSLDLKNFLSEVLNGVVRLNNLFTELLDRASRQGDPQWKRRFTMSIVDDTATLVSESTLPVFLASLAMDVEANGGLGRSESSIGLNLPIIFARHQLIYEAGSVQAYRATWQYSRMKTRFDKAVGKLEKSVKNVVDTALTFLSTLRRLLLDDSVEDARAAVECNALLSLFGDVLHSATRDVGDARVAGDVLNKAAADKTHQVGRAYAAAQVALFRNGVPVPPSLVDAVAVTAPRPVGEEVRSLQDIVARVSKRVYKMWFHAKDTKLDPVEVVALLRAMVTLELWSPPCLDDTLLASPYGTDARWPDPPPLALTEAEILAARNKAIRKVHPDKVGVQPSDEAKWKESTDLASKVNSAVALLKRFFIGQTEPGSPRP